VAFNVSITPGSLNVGKVLHDAGYATGFVGKWHTGAPPLVRYAANADMKDPKVAQILAENHKRMCEYIKQCGFDYAASIYRGNLKDHKLDALTVHNMEWVTKGALDFIEQYKDKPFFLHICPTLHHSPPPIKSIAGDWRVTPAGLLTEPLNVQAPRSSIGPRLKEVGIPENMGHATWLDDGIGAVLKKLEDLKLADDTMVLYFSDNATRGGKGACYEGGAHTLALMYWRGRLPTGTTCDKLVENIDFVPTILDACAVTPPAEMKIDGASLIPMLTGKETKWRDAIFLEVGHSRAVCTARWKYIAVRYPAQTEQAVKGKPEQKRYHSDGPLGLQETAAANHPCYFDADQLYDLEKDPDEKVNLANDPKYAETLSEMKARLKSFLDRFPRPFGEFKQ
jgi:arylsulfatase A-like enzyme